MDWIIADMDQGIIRRESSRRAALGWILGYGAGQVLSRHDYPGRPIYDYVIGNPGEEETASSYCLLRVDVAHRWGFDWAFELPDQYPFPTQPYKRGALDDIEREQLRRYIERSSTRSD